jgi:hypothetical protein
MVTTEGLFVTQSTEVWSRYQVKQMEQAIHPKKHTYVWYEMDFLALRSASGWTTVLCFDTPDRFRQRLFETLASSPQTPTEPDIYQLYIYLINQILNLYDESVWAIRDIVRDVEIVSGVDGKEVWRVTNTP